MQIVAITGAIGCGKTTIAGIIRRLGYVVYDVDKWCRRLYYEHDFLQTIKENFPFCWQDGVFNKRILRNYVFANKAELNKLEKLTHPFLKQKFLQAIHKNCRTEDIVFVDVALLFEMGWNQYCTDIIVADVPYEIQKQRVIHRDKISEEDFLNILKVQMPNRVRIGLADYVVTTDKSLGCLKANLIELIKEIKSC